MGAPPAVPPILILRFPRAAPHPWGATPPARPFVGAGLGPAPTKGLESAGQIQAPLKRGLSPPKAVTGGFSSPAGTTEKNRRKETLRHGFAVPPPFSREVFDTPRTDGTQRRGRQGIGQTLRSSARSPSRRPNAESLRSPLYRPARWDVPGQAHPAGADGPGFCQGRPQWTGRGSAPPLDPLAPVVTAKPPIWVPRPP